MTNLRALRLDRGQSLRELADELGVSDVAVMRWEHGTSYPRPALGKRLRDTLGLPLSVILAPAPENENGGPEAAALRPSPRHANNAGRSVRHDKV